MPPTRRGKSDHTPPRGMFGYSIHMTRLRESMPNVVTALSPNLSVTPVAAPDIEGEATPAAIFMDAPSSARGKTP